MELEDLRIRSAERLLIDAFDEFRLAPKRVLTTTLGRGQFAARVQETSPEAHVLCHFFDLYPAGESRELFEQANRPIEVHCDVDLPAGPFDLVALPSSRGGDSELARDLLQQGFDRLAMGGTLLASVDNPKDVWLQHEIEKLQKGVTRKPTRYGVIYRLTKKRPLKRLRNFRAEFAFRDNGTLVKAVSRPGVFSHRQLDLGARALLESLQVKPGDRVVDIGCGSGAVGLAAALREDDIHVLALDSDAKAITSAHEGAELNGVAHRYIAVLTADGSIPDPGTYDLAVGNPPYYSHFAIAELFLQTARAALRPGGTVLMVTRQLEWFQARMKQLFTDVEADQVRTYTVLRGVKK